VLLLAGLVLAGCGDDGSERGAASGGTFPSTTSAGSTAPTTAAPGPGCTDEPGRPGTSRQTLPDQGERRPFILDVPESYDPLATGPAALIVNLHGFGSGAEQQRLYSRLQEATDAVVVTPQGLGDRPRWSLVPGPDNPDVRFVRHLVTRVSREYCIDPDRIHATGISNGSALSAELACAAPDLFASVALVAATVPPLGCDPATRVPVLAFHGSADPVVPYEGGPIASIGFANGLRVPPAEEAITRWAVQDGCDPEPTVQPGADVTHWRFEGCDADVELYRVEGAGHVWPGAVSTPALDERLGPNTTTIDASALISEWFADHPQEG